MAAPGKSLSINISSDGFKSTSSSALRSPMGRSMADIAAESPKKYMSGYGGHQRMEEPEEEFRVITPTVGYRGYYKGKVEGKLGRINLHKANLSSPVEDLDSYDAALNHDRFANPPTASGELSRPGSAVRRPMSPATSKTSSPNKNVVPPSKSGSSRSSSEINEITGKIHAPKASRTSPNSKFNPKTEELKARVDEANEQQLKSPSKEAAIQYGVDSTVRDIRRALTARHRTQIEVRTCLKFAFKPVPGGNASMCKLADFCEGLEQLPLHITVGQITTLCNEFSDDLTGLIDLKRFYKKVAPEITAF